MRFQGQILRQKREAKRLLQAELANQVGVSAKTISRWESDLYEPRKREVARLAEVFACPEDDFYGTSSSVTSDNPSEPEDSLDSFGRGLQSILQNQRLMEGLLQSLHHTDNPLEFDRALWDRSMEELETVAPGALRSARDFLKLSLADVARLSGLTSQRLTEIETETGIPISASEVMKLRSGLGVAFEPRAVAYSGMSLQSTKDKRPAAVRLAESKRTWESHCQRTPNKLDSIMAMLLEMRRELNELKQEVRGRQH